MTDRRDRRRSRPPIGRVLEPLESRDLPSAAVFLAAARLRLIHSSQVVTVVNGQDLGAPTAREQRREFFVAKLTGSYVTGPPQFTNEGRRVSFVARRGGSNQSLHVYALVAINTPADPSLPISRASASVFPQNVATTGSTLALDLTADPTGDPKALPTHLFWTVDGGSGGLYSNAVSTTPGTLVIHYRPHRSLPGGFQSGSASLVFKGQILTTGTGSIVNVGL